MLCLKGGRPHVVEYYELSSEMANEKIDGELVYKYGVILNYLFNVNRLKEIASKNIPLHIVKKKVEYIDENGEKLEAETTIWQEGDTASIEVNQDGSYYFYVEGFNDDAGWLNTTFKFIVSYE